jgi:uncharacterized membrane protein YgdD (TMEM256/DUF423 family)
MQRIFMIIAAIVGCSGVAIGAFGAHGLEATLTANARLDTFNTATLYHLIHALAIAAAAWASSQWPGRYTRWAGWLFLLGIILFSGSLYLLSVFNLRFMGAVAPVGGAAFLAGWACLGLAAWQKRQI